MANKTPLILVPGLVCDDRLWQAQVEGLSDIAEMTIPDHKSHDSVPAIADSILANAPERFALAGLSMGGYIALEIYRQAGQRITRLALLDTAPYADKPEQSAMRRQRMEKADKDGLRAISNEMLPLLIHPDRLGEAELTQAILAMDESYTPQSYRNQQTAIISRNDSVALLAEISCPTLVLCGRQDQLTPLAAHEEMAEKIPDAELVVIEACGHMSTMERPAQVVEAMRRWLQG